MKDLPMKISDLYLGLRPTEDFAIRDPFTPAVLEDAEVIDTRVTLREYRSGFILQGTMALPGVDTIVLVAENLVRIDMTTFDPVRPRRLGRHDAPLIGLWQVEVGAQSTLVVMGIERLGQIEIEAQRFGAHFGIVPGLPAYPPDYQDDSDETIRTGVPTWDSDFVHRHSRYITSSAYKQY